MRRAPLHGISFVAVAMAMTVAGSVTACGSACGSGADSATEAVTGLLEAASSDGNVCRFVPEGGETAARQVVDGLGPRIQAAGGLDKLAIVERSGRQMGREHVVAVTAGPAPLREFVVVEEDGAFLVLVDIPAANPG